MNQENNVNNKDFRLKGDASSLNSEFDFVLFLHLFKKSIVWFIVLIAISLISALIYLRYTIPIYESKLVLQVTSKNTANQVLQVTNFQENEGIARDVELLRSKFLLKRALNKLPIDVGYYNKGNFLVHDLYKVAPIKVNYQVKDSSVLGVPFFIEFTEEGKFKLYQDELFLGEFANNKEIKLSKVNFRITIVNYERIDDLEDQLKNNRLFFRLNNIDQIANEYLGRLNVMPLNVSAKTISISFRDNNNKKAADLVTALADEYIIYDVEERSRSSKKVISFIDNQLDKYYNKVKASENKIQYFQKTSKVSSVEEFSSIYSEQMDKLENQLVDIDLQRGILGEIKGAVLGELKQGNIVSSLLPILTGTEYEGGISSLINTLKELLLKRQNLLYEVTSDSEIAKSLDYQIDVQKNILIGSITTLTNKLEKRRKEIIKKANEIEAKYLSVPQKALDYARLQRVLSIDEKFLALLMNKRTEYSISEAGFVSQHTVLSAASIPTIPESPKKRLVLVAGLLVGIILSAILLIIRYLLKNTISSIEEITKLMNASIGILGAIPRYKHNIPVSQLVVDKSPKSIIAESFRSVRTSLKFISGDSDKKIMAITSTISGEGKTFFAINIGGIISLTGKKVVILDLDMRKPKIHLGFEVENERGMSTLLIGKDKIEQCIHHSSLENLDFITSGPVPPNPSELIINGEIDKVIKELKKTYDLIIIDNPPIGLVSDAMEMLQKADYPIYIFKSEYSKKSFIKNVDKLVLEDGISKLAVVLNSVEINRHSYGYGYGYGYGDGYYDIPELDKKSLMERVLGK